MVLSCRLVAVRCNTHVVRGRPPDQVGRYITQKECRMLHTDSPNRVVNYIDPSQAEQ